MKDARELARALLRALGAGPEYDDYLNEGGTAVEFLAKLIGHLTELTAFGVTEEGLLAFRCLFSVYGGDQPAFVVRAGCLDIPVEMAFTPEGVPWEPEWALLDTPVSVISARQLWRMINGVTE